MKDFLRHCCTVSALPLLPTTPSLAAFASGRLHARHLDLAVRDKHLVKLRLRHGLDKVALLVARVGVINKHTQNALSDCEI